MTAKRAECTVLIETALSMDDLRPVFARCGGIRDTFAAAPLGDSGLYRYYIEYRDREAAKKARALHLSEAAVHSVDVQNLPPHFDTAIPPDLPPKPSADVLRWSPYKVRHKERKTIGKISPLNHTRTKSASASSSSHLLHPVEILAPLRIDSKEDYFACDSSRPRGHTEHPLTSVSSADAYIGLPTSTCLNSSGFATDRTNVQTPDAFPILQGGAYDLHSGCQDLAQVIGILRATAGGVEGRGKWIIAAIDYVRSHDTLAAIRVLTAMMEVMLGNGLDEADLKPALLLLANCCREMSKKLRHTPGDARALEESKQYDTQAIDLFRKVFGGGSCPPPIFECSRADRAQSPSNTGAIPATPRTRDTNRRALLQKGDSTPSHAAAPTPPRVENSTPSATPRAELPSPRRTPDDTSASSPRSLERQICALRDRLQSREKSLSQERRERRKVEDNLRSGRARRHKLENQLRTAQDSAVEALCGEQTALEHYRVELAKRKQGEEHIAEMRERIVMLETKLGEAAENDRKTKGALRKMGLCLLKASAQGDVTMSPT